MSGSWRVGLFVVVFAATAAANPQSFNIDLDVAGGPPEAGHGVPVSSFGAAANQSGFWNRVGVTTPGPDPLFDLTGSATTTVVTVTGFGSGGGSGFPVNTGNYALLLNDYANIPDNMVYRFSGILPGSYKVFTYAVNATGMTVPVQVSIDGASTPTQLVTGPMPGNSFAQGITHTLHEVPNLSGDLVVRLVGPWPDAVVNGFQVVAVPEPTTMLVLGLGSIWLLRRRAE